VSDTAGRILLSLVTPERKLLEEAVEEVVLPGSEGYLGVLPGHAPLLTGLKTGELTYTESGRRHACFVTGGFVEVLPDRVSVLADVGERAEEIDVERARAAKDRAEKRLKGGEDVDWDRARAALSRALARIQIAGRK
jgi:F-type H+-transporting ATPase subunit epsilon